MGEILPAPENCKTPEDENCDGSTPQCAPGDIAWSRWLPVSTFPAYSFVRDLRFDANDDLVAVFGVYSPGTLDLGLEPVVSGPCGNTLVVAKLDGETGATVWQAPIFGVDADYGGSLAVQANDSIAVAVSGALGCDTEVDGLVVPGPQSVLILDPDGHPTSYIALPDQLGSYHIAARQGGLIVGGDYMGPVDFGGGITLPNAASDAGFVAALDNSGQALWALPLGLAVRAIDADETGATFASWHESGSVFSGNTATMRVGAISASGALGWSRALTATNIQNVYGIWSVRAHGGIWAMGGMLYADADFGFGAVAATAYNSFLFTFDPAGNQLFAKWLDQHGDSPHVEVDPAGGLYLSGGFNGFGDYLYRLTAIPTVTPVWSKKGGAGPLAADSAGNVVLARTDTSFDLAYILEKYAR